MGYASLMFWPFTFLGHYHHEDLVATLLFSYLVLPFITARIARGALQQGKILRAYIISAVTAIPVAALLVYFIAALLLGALI
jgi:hypothetical protein